MASSIQQTWTWANFGGQWRTEKTRCSPRGRGVGRDLATEPQRRSDAGMLWDEHSVWEAEGWAGGTTGWAICTCQGPAAVKSKGYLGNCVCSCSWAQTEQSGVKKVEWSHQAVKSQENGLQTGGPMEVAVRRPQDGGKGEPQTWLKTSGGRTSPTHCFLIAFEFTPRLHRCNQSGLRGCPAEETGDAKKGNQNWLGRLLQRSVHCHFSRLHYLLLAQ